MNVRMEVPQKVPPAETFTSIVYVALPILIRSVCRKENGRVPAKTLHEQLTCEWYGKVLGPLAFTPSAISCPVEIYKKFLKACINARACPHISNQVSLMEPRLSSTWLWCTGRRKQYERGRNQSCISFVATWRHHKFEDFVGLARPWLDKEVLNRTKGMDC